MSGPGYFATAVWGTAIATWATTDLIRRQFMFRKTFAMMLSGIILVTAFGLQHAGAQVTNDQQATEKIKTKVQKIGVGSNARVEVKLRDNTQLRGYINNADQDSFTVFDSKTGSSRTVAYADTSSVKKAGSGISAKTWIILGAAVVGAAVTWVIVKPALCDGGAQTRGPC
jgi:small nuclear ribonucleoprotein (snRNP)-like protein